MRVSPRRRLASVAATSLAVLGLVALAAACRDGAQQDSSADAGVDGPPCPPPATGDLPCDVAAVLQAKCQTCHQNPPLPGVVWPLLTFEDTQQPWGASGKRRFQRMAEVIAPDGVPWMPKAGAPQLTASEHALLAGWLAACAPPVAQGMGCDRGE